MNSFFAKLNYSFLAEFSDNFEDLGQVLKLIEQDSIDQVSSLTDRLVFAINAESNIPPDFFRKKTSLIRMSDALIPQVKDQLLKELGQSVEESSQKQLLEAFKLIGLPESLLGDEEQQVITEVGFCSFEKSAAPFKTLKLYQSKVVAEASEILSANFARCIIQMPTGSGKTRTALELVMQQLNLGHDVIWLANSEELVDQAYNSFCESWPHLASVECVAVNHQRFSASIEYGARCAFHVSTIQGLFNEGGRTSSALSTRLDKMSLLVVDEAHMALAPEFRKVIERFAASAHCKLLGLTATPGRSYENHDENAALANMFHNRVVKIKNNNGAESTMDFLRDRGIISHVKQSSIEIEWLESELSDLDLSDSEKNDLTDELLERIAHDADRNYMILKSLEGLAQTGKSILYFGTTVLQSKLITTLLKLRQVPVAHVDGSTKNRSRVIQQFRAGEISVLCNYGVLHTGFDAPNTDVVFIARPTKSIVLYSQMIGRGLRGPAIGGKEFCHLITVNDNITGLISNDEISTYFDGYFVEE